MTDTIPQNGGGGHDVQPASIVPYHEAETAVSAVAAQAVANVQARYAIAKRMPRDWDEVRVKLLKECKRPRFAECAIYHKPIGKGIEGPSIRFAEAALRCMGNALPGAFIVYDDDEKRIIRVSVTDLENNLTYEKDITITKTVERRDPKGAEVMGQRKNKQGITVYIVKATDDDLLNKENALVSKALRTNGLRHIPGDILDEALDMVQATLRNNAAQDPDAAKRKLVDAFAELGVQPADLIGYLKHALDKVTPAELAHLRAVYTSLKDGETTWAEIVAKPDGDKEAAPAESQTSKTREKLQQRRQGKADGQPQDPDDLPVWGEPAK